MKELSIEEKAQRYDEALERAKSVIEQNPLMEYLKKGIEYIFKLNEDERIRKGIIRNLEYLMDSAEGFVKDELRERIAWLDRQAEQKPADVRTTGYWHVEDIERKPAWSEEDESYLNTTIAYLKDAKEFKKTAENCINWLKSLKERVQPKQEWSEEDEAMYQGVIETEQYMLDVVHGRKIFDVGNEGIMGECAKELNWLKSIRPQKWKPSDEQITALRWVLNNIPYNKHKEEISGLLDQIKEL